VNLPAIKLAGLKAKLQWSADGEWSVYIKPEECALLLEELDTPRRTGQIIHGDNTKPEENDGERRESKRAERCTDHP